jgi:protein-S-isoprenylcysteine O-methyltransferase Ste14
VYLREGKMIEILGEPYSLFGLIILILVPFLLILIVWLVLKEEREHQEEFKNYGE